MAKKKAAADEDAGASTADFVDRIYESIHNDYGNGAIIAGEDYIANKPMRIPFSPKIDIILQGGIEEGSFVGITGNEKMGKTMTSLSFAATCQRPEYGSRPIFYGKCEGRLSREHTQGIRGLNTAKPHFNVIQSVEGKILSAEDHLVIYEEILKKVPGCVLIIDSISSLVEKKVLNEGVGAQTRGSGAKLFSQWLDIIKDVVVTNRCVVIGITHLISNTSGMGSPVMEKVTRNWRYMVNYHLKADKKTNWTAGNAENGKVIGLKIEWKTTASANGGTPFGSAESLFRFGVGVDYLAEMISVAVSVNIIKTSGTWCTLDFLAKLDPKLGDTKAQGVEKVYRLLADNPEWAKALEMELSGLMIEPELVATKKRE